MKIAHLSSGVEGGADIAAARIHRLFLRGGHDSRFFHWRDRSPDPTFRSFEKPLRVSDLFSGKAVGIKNKILYGNISPACECFTNPWGNSEVVFDMLQFPDVDIITFHWISNFIDLEPFLRSVPSRVKFIWVLHDLNPLTGGCHYTNGCRRFETGCYQCPQLLNDGLVDLVKMNFRIKLDVYKKYLYDRVHLVPDSNWVASEVKRSALFRDTPLTVVHYPVETEVFRPHDMMNVRESLGLNKEKFTILFGSVGLHNQRKGMDLLLDAIKELAVEMKDRLQVITFGSGGLDIAGVEVKNFGRVTGREFLALLYNAADYFIMPSKEEALGQTAMESLCCGTPVVAFRIGGLIDTVDATNGIFADAVTARSLADAIRTATQTGFDRTAISAVAHRRYSFDAKQREYASVYEAVLAGAGRRSLNERSSGT